MTSPMSLLRPFRGLLPPVTLAPSVASLPYDVVSREEATLEAGQNPHSLFHVTRPEVDLPPALDEHDLAVHTHAAAALRAFVQRGWLQPDDCERLYLYRQKMGTHVQTGVVALASVEAYERGDIKRHEHTRRDKEEDRVLHLDTVGAHDEPVFLTYPARVDIDTQVAEATAEPPHFDFHSKDGVGHTLWRLSSERTKTLGEALGKVPALYIADGHHRSAAAARVFRLRKERGHSTAGVEGFLAVAFPHTQLQVLGYHRVVRDLNGLSAEQFLSAVSARFEVSLAANAAPTRARTFGMYLGRRWYAVYAAEREGDGEQGLLASLDASLLQDRLLGPVLGIEDPRTEPRISFVGGIRGTGALERAVDSGAFAVAFALHPVSVEQMMRVADLGQVMPPKSTWFEPKLRSGLVLNPFRDLL